jgi:23S rRNA (adenine2030-N6)-methyltransferase
MNYRHAFHAGNFADVLKHLVLVLCIEYLKRKDGPFRIIDTHAGCGRYRLDGGEAQRTGEWQQGIGRLMGPEAEPLPEHLLSVVAPYLDIVRHENGGGGLTVYPGSPLIAANLLRRNDVLIANELHPEDASVLKSVFAKDRRVKVMTLDGWTALKALLPPNERRGLVLIDPPFEAPGELIRLTEGLVAASQRFSSGITLLWYPIKDPKPVARFHRAIAETGLKKLLKIELLLRAPRNPDVLNGTGLVVSNPPFTLAGELEVVLPELCRRFGQGRSASIRVESLG